ncbi:hypothetical protein BOSEA1005_20971 [Hyphomicrobiales bacterium]|nr:hypothetical protein BOSEA1005_20971 [Hyphomicrobiales bacterium]
MFRSSLLRGWNGTGAGVDHCHWQ